MEFLPQIILILGIHLAAAMSPGPNFVVVTATALADGTARASRVVLGICTAAVVWVVITLFGLTLLLAQSSAWETWVRLLGGAYLLYLGFQSLRSAGRARTAASGPESDPGPAAEADRGGYFLKGLAINLSNPKSAAYYLSIAALMTGQEFPGWVGPVTGAGMVLTSLTWYSTLALLFGRPAIRSFYDRRKGWIDGPVGLLLIGLGLKLIFSAS